jgi:hypothetical protein
MDFGHVERHRNVAMSHSHHMGFEACSGMDYSPLKINRTHVHVLKILFGQNLQARNIRLVFRLSIIYFIRLGPVPEYQYDLHTISL